MDVSRRIVNNSKELRTYTCGGMYHKGLYFGQNESRWIALKWETASSWGARVGKNQEFENMYHTDLPHTECADCAEKVQLTATSFLEGWDLFGAELVRTLLSPLVANSSSAISAGFAVLNRARGRA